MASLSDEDRQKAIQISTRPVRRLTPLRLMILNFAFSFAATFSSGWSLMSAALLLSGAS